MVRSSESWSSGVSFDCRSFLAPEPNATLRQLKVNAAAPASVGVRVLRNCSWGDWPPCDAVFRHSLIINAPVTYYLFVFGARCMEAECARARSSYIHFIFFLLLAHILGYSDMLYHLHLFTSNASSHRALFVALSRLLELGSDWSPAWAVITSWKGGSASEFFNFPAALHQNEPPQTALSCC